MFPENVRQDLITMVPSSVLSEISCFALYDNHPQGDRIIDVLICTRRKEIIEFYKREQISSILLNASQNFRDVRSFRNANCELFYLVETEDELYILSTKEKLILEHRLTEVESYEIFDPISSGRASLKVIHKDDAVPLYFDDNFINVGETCFKNEVEQPDNSAPIIMQLTRKLTEVKFSVKCSEKKYNEYLNLRQIATFYFFQNMTPRLNESLFKLNSKEIASCMDLTTWSPWVKLCNKKLIIAFNLLNKNEVALEQVHILLNSCIKKSMVYVTKLLQKTQSHWAERDDQEINPNSEVTIVTCIDIKELQNNINSKIEFDMVLAFKKSGKDYLLPFDKVIISVSDVMKEDFSALGSSQKDELQTFLAVLATCSKIELCLRHIREEGDEPVTAADIFCKYLKMEEFVTIKNVFIHRTSPYHTLHGLVVIFGDSEDNSGKFTVEIYSRCPSQVLALIHYINEIVPFRILVTTPNYKITANVEQLAHYNEEVPVKSNHGINYSEYAMSVLNQTSILLEYIDSCMIKMNESKNKAVLDKIGFEVDIFACGLEKFREFRNNMLNEIYAGIEMCSKNKRSRKEHEKSQVIFIDDDLNDCFAKHNL